MNKVVFVITYQGWNLCLLCWCVPPWLTLGTLAGNLKLKARILRDTPKKTTHLSRSAKDSSYPPQRLAKLTRQGILCRWWACPCCPEQMCWGRLWSLSSWHYSSAETLLFLRSLKLTARQMPTCFQKWLWEITGCMIVTLRDWMKHGLLSESWAHLAWCALKFIWENMASFTHLRKKLKHLLPSTSKVFY